jgi:hypothetical protein
MELPSLIKQVLAKVVPTTALQNDKIANGCQLWYEKLIAGVEKKEKSDPPIPLTLVDKGVKQLDTWYVQLLFAMSYFVIVRFVQDLMNPGDGDPDHETDPR